MATHARQQYFADESSLSKEKREFSIADEIQEKIDSVEEGAQVNTIETIKVNGAEVQPDWNKAVNLAIPGVVDSLDSISSTDALSARQGKVLYDYIQDVSHIGHFLALWDASTGLPVTNPEVSPYVYNTGDFYTVSNVASSGGTNYKPDGTQYVIGQASTTVDTDSVAVNDFYFYDGTTWRHMKNSGAGSIAIDGSLSTTSTNPVENRVITNAINGKQNTLIAGTNIQIAADGKTISATDTTYSAGANISIDANNEISAVDTTYSAGTNVQISNQNVISATDTKYTAGTGINIDANNVISNTQTSAEWGNITGTLSNQTDLQNALDAKQDDMVILSYGNSTWNDFITAYQKNGVVYCRASSSSDPSTGSQGRLAFMAYVNNASNPTEVEFQYYRSRSDHNSAANQLDEVYVYKLTSNGIWTVTQRNTAAKAVAGTGINLAFGSGNMTISADTTVLATKTDLNSKQDTLVSGTNIKSINNNSLLGNGNLTLNDVKSSATAPSSPTEGMVWYDTTNDVLKVYDGSQWNAVIQDESNVKIFSIPDIIWFGATITEQDYPDTFNVLKEMGLWVAQGFITDSSYEAIDSTHIAILRFKMSNGFSGHGFYVVVGEEGGFYQDDNNWDIPMLTFQCAPDSGNNGFFGVYFSLSSSSTSITINSSPHSFFQPLNSGTTGQVLTKTSSAYEWQDASGGLQVAPNSPITGIKYVWYGTEADYANLNQYYTDTPGDTEFRCF